MKTQEFKRFSDPELEANLKTAKSDELELIKLESRKMATRPLHLPLLCGDHMSSYFEDFHLFYQSLIESINKRLQKATTVNSVIQKREATSKKTLALSNIINETDKKLLVVNKELESKPKPPNQNNHKWVMIIIGFLSLFDGFFSIPIFESYGYSYFESCIAGLMFSIILAFFAHMFPKIIAFGKNRIQRILITLVLTILSIGLFIWMSMSRVAYLEGNALANGATISYNPIPFILTSILIIGVSIFVSFIYYPTKEEFKAIREYNKLEDEKAELLNTKKASEDEIETLEKEQDEFISAHGSLIVYASNLEKNVIADAKSAYAVYKKNNLMNRSDGKPDCFDQPYPFDFVLYFITIKLLRNEND
ncbi:MAG: hypothetical protein Q8M15_17080 [Bacteroidota bacterium]|nr:hypothetical protein [Bacteroidota bacterium]